MEKLSRSVRKRLDEYVSHLDRMIELDKKGLEYVRKEFNPTPMPEYGPLAVRNIEIFQEAARPISRTITAYGDARSELYRLFPELKKKK